MEPLILFERWRKSRECTAKEAWMAGYAAGCHRGHRKGRRDGKAEGERERELLLSALRTFLDGAPWDLGQVSGRDSRDDRFLLAKLLTQAERGETSAWQGTVAPARANPGDD